MTSADYMTIHRQPLQPLPAFIPLSVSPSGPCTATGPHTRPSGHVHGNQVTHMRPDHAHSYWVMGVAVGPHTQLLGDTYGYWAKHTATGPVTGPQPLIISGPHTQPFGHRYDLCTRAVTFTLAVRHVTFVWLK